MQYYISLYNSCFKSPFGQVFANGWSTVRLAFRGLWILPLGGEKRVGCQPREPVYSKLSGAAPCYCFLAVGIV
jgi:hypothetical protein